MGIRISRGKYLLLIDNDDAITTTALEELYAIAEKFQADVVYCEKYYQVSLDGESTGAVQISTYQKGGFVTEPTLISDNIFERVTDFLKVRFMWALWTKLIRRDFVLENDLQLIDCDTQDLIFTACLVCTAPRIVRVPNIVNFWRIRPDSLSRRKRDELHHLHEILKALNKGCEYLDKFLRKHEFFRLRPDLRYAVMEMQIASTVPDVINMNAKIPLPQLNEIIRAELGQAENLAELTVFFFSRMNTLSLKIFQQQQIIQRLQEQIQQPR